MRGVSSKARGSQKRRPLFAETIYNKADTANAPAAATTSTPQTTTGNVATSTSPQKNVSVQMGTGVQASTTTNLSATSTTASTVATTSASTTTVSPSGCVSRPTNIAGARADNPPQTLLGPPTTSAQSAGTNTDPPQRENICESALAQRRSAYLPKLRQLSDANSMNISMDQSNREANERKLGEINFVYADCDTFANEMAELYSYSEVDEWAVNMEAFLNYVNSKKLSTAVWMCLEKREKHALFIDLIQHLESTSVQERLEALRILLYILQGAFADFESPRSEVVTDAMDEARGFLNHDSADDFMEKFCLLQAACNAYSAYEAGIFRALCECLFTEANDVADNRGGDGGHNTTDRIHSAMSTHSAARSLSSADGGDGRSATRRFSTLADNEMLRAALSCLYHMVESMRRQEVLAQCSHVSDYSSAKLENLQQQFIRELAAPLDVVEKPLVLFLFDMIPLFIRGSCTKYPIKKIVLLAWKTMLATFGDMDFLREEKARQRAQHNLAPIEDTIQYATRIRASNFTNWEAMSESTAFSKAGRRFRGAAAATRAFNRQSALNAIHSGSSGEDSGAGSGSDSDSPTSPNSAEGSPTDADSPTTAAAGNQTASPVSAPPTPETPTAAGDQTPTPPMPSAGTPLPPRGDDKPIGDVVPLTPNADAAAFVSTPAAFTSASRDENDASPQNGGDKTPLAGSPLPPQLPWSSKVRRADIEAFVQNARQKFFGFRLPDDAETLFGLPGPVQQSVEALRRHIYVSLGEVQIEEDKLFNKYSFSRKEQIPETPVERLYMRMIPSLSTDAVCFLKVLLAAVPSAKAKSDSALILSDVLTKFGDTSDMLSSSLNLDVSNSAQNLLEEAVRMAIDINRHKEIITKATTAILINLLKFFRLSHIYEFENFSQQLVLTNCLPLVLKFLDQNMVKYFQSKNEIAPLSYPRAVVHYATNCRQWPVLNAENVGESRMEEPCYYMWRNVFASVNLVRILNKLTKNKHSRTMMLMVFKSAPILKRCLKIQLGIFQLYTLKLLKMQARYLGRQWRRTNMEIISSIYMKVRHRLNDDWAFANETRCKSWDFQMEERELKTAIERFNYRRYGHLYPELVLGLEKDAEEEAAAANGNGDDSDFDPADFEPVDNAAQSVLAGDLEFTTHFKRNYEHWLQRAVFAEPPLDWDSVVAPSAVLNEALNA